MNKASRALRRSSVHLKSIGTGHRQLKMVISEFKNVRSAAKDFAIAQSTAFEEMLKWSSSDENIIFSENFSLLSELNSLWNCVQKEFADRLKDFIHQFEMILEGEQEINEARNNVVVCELRESKIRKELKKENHKRSRANISHLEAKLLEAQRNKDMAVSKVIDKIRENEAVKIIRIRSGLLRLSKSYLILAEKSHIIHEANHKVAYCIPADEDSANIQEIKCSRMNKARNAVNKAKERIREYRPATSTYSSPPGSSTAPPPYSDSSSSPYNPHFSPLSSSSPSAPPTIANDEAQICEDNRQQNSNQHFTKNLYSYDAFSRYYNSPVWPGCEEEDEELWPSGCDSSDLVEAFNKTLSQ